MQFQENQRNIYYPQQQNLNQVQENINMNLQRSDNYSYNKMIVPEANQNPFDNFLNDGLVSKEFYEEFIKSEPSETIHYDCPANDEVQNALGSHDKEFESELSQLLHTPLNNERENTKNLQTDSLVSEYTVEEFGDSLDSEDDYEPKRVGKRMASKDREQDKTPMKMNKKIRKGKSIKKPKEDTKNLLRNFGNAQNKFAKDHKYSVALINSKYMELNPKLREQKVKEFKKWIPTKLENFKQFQDVWSKKGEYSDLYREICWDFYEKFAAHYIYSASRMSEENTRKTHQKYIYRFLEGIINPSIFFFFKSTKN